LKPKYQVIRGISTGDQSNILCFTLKKEIRLSEKKRFTTVELAEYDGQDGKSSFIAYKERVFDVTGSRLWAKGLHMMRHHAGKELSEDFTLAPHGLDVLDRYPQVGILKTEGIAVPDKRKMPRILGQIFSRFPLLNRHPHPFIVHFPLAFLVSSPLFTALYLITGTRSFELTSFYCLAGGLLFAIAAIPSGLLTWWVNHAAHFYKPVIIKIILSPILFIIGLAVLIWRFQNPLILENIASWDYLYLFLLFLMAPLVLTIGWYGASITFPLHKE
jgi:predicted heme/steroid binding protein/uncharacterized membrane protein